MDDIIQKLQMLRDETIPLRPIYEPYNEQAKALVDKFHWALNLPEDRPTSVEKQKLVVCGFLAAAQRAFSLSDKGKNFPDAVAISSNRDWWSQYPFAGYEIAQQVQKALVAGDFVELVELTGLRHFWRDEEDKLRWLGTMRTFFLNDNILHIDDFVEAEFIETGRPTVLVGVEETRGKRIARKLIKRRKPKMKLQELRKTFGKAYTVASMEVEGLNTFWNEHPLALPQLGNGVRRYVASATRVYHDGRLDSGGRFFGAWTGMNSSYRLQCTIDGERLAEVDLNASQPTLFSAMVGMPMKVGGMWEDLYSHILEAVDLTSIDADDDEVTRRGKIKQVTMEVIGTGNPDKRKEADYGDYTFADGEFTRYRRGLLTVVPALYSLDADYMNGSGYVSYHEAQIMMLTLHQLKSMGIPAYPIHDCLLVKEKDVETATNAYRETIRSYVKEYGKGGIDITVPVSIERNDEDKQRIVGYYSSS